MGTSHQSTVHQPRHIQQAAALHTTTSTIMLRCLVATSLLLAVNGQDYENPVVYENRRRGSVDEDAGFDYDYNPGNGLKGPVGGPALVPLGEGVRKDLDGPRAPSRLPPAPPRQSFKPRPSDSGYRPRERPNNGLVGKEACQTGAKSVGHESACDLYYDCYEGQGFLQACPNGLVYAGDGRYGLVGECDYPHNVNCNGRPEMNPPQSTEHCDWLYGIFGHETSCTRYWTCWNGTATEQFCIGGLLYNEETHACDWPQNVAGCQKHPLCKDDANGNVPLGKSCNRYWACQGGYPRLQRCPAMLVFDKDRKRCVTPPTEDCEVPTTSAPQPGDENFNEGSFDGNTGSGPRSQSTNPRRGGGGGPRRRPPPPQGAVALPVDGGAGEDRPALPFNLPPGAQPLN